MSPDGFIGFDAKAVGNEFLRLAAERGASLDATKLQQLVYIAHGRHLAGFGSPLVAEAVRAKRCGPVFASLYQELKEYGGRRVEHEMAYRAPGGEFKPYRLEAADGFDVIREKNAQVAIREVWSEFGDKTAEQIVGAGSAPWAERYRESRSGVIDDESIRVEVVEELTAGYLDPAEGAAGIIGKWPGTETDDEVRLALADI